MNPHATSSLPELQTNYNTVPTNAITRRVVLLIVLAISTHYSSHALASLIQGNSLFSFWLLLPFCYWSADCPDRT